MPQALHGRQAHVPTRTLTAPAHTQRQYDPAPRPKQDLEQLVSAVEELPFLSSNSSQVEQTSRLLCASSEAMKRGSWRDWSSLLHGLATAGMHCSSSPDLTRLCDQAVQLLPEKLAWGAEGQSIGMTFWAMAKSGYTGSAQPLLQSVTAAISKGSVIRPQPAGQ
ncbi:hypothetical protein HaLaN_03397 [Haematococcus lacustris]|uniref:Uncharacterized protein n=1 Tax=Haematococcus lacustris TaxID=44745 RepID=A0A699YNE5_HAELA|nr:hypothetical protein HaLaN_03397 [Haematococcus lacustris]